MSTTTPTITSTTIKVEDNKENERKEYLLGLLKNGVQITNREREELMFKFKINDLSLFRTGQPSSQAQSHEILNGNTLNSFSKLEIKTNGSENDSDNDSDNDNDNDNENEYVGNEIKSENLKKYQYREIDEDAQSDKSILQKINQDFQELSKINNNKINNNNNNNNNNNDKNDDGDDFIENSIANNNNKHDYVCENCKWCDGYEIDSKSKEQLCINCKCSLIHHITTNFNGYDDDDDDDNDNDEEDYFDNSSDEADYYGDHH
ncbi:hypothetical protein ACTFIR_004769 [Dictyostelium discoideum]